MKGDGTVVAWGSNSRGQSLVPAGLSGVTAVSGGGSHSLAVKGDGTVVAWGSNTSGQSLVPAGLSGVTAVSAGASHSLALKGDGTVVAWGYDGNGQSSVPAGLSRVTAVSAGAFHSLALVPAIASTSSATAAVTAGVLSASLTSVAFDAVDFSHTPQAVTAAATLTADDLTGTESGWAVTLQSSALVFTDLDNVTDSSEDIAATALALAPVTAVTTGAGDTFA
ncbi:RCC1 domain-containing protein, partial [Cryobacterium sp. Y11]|uniref:RCC1 domain-containing protein n=1 Tax=Cryobacterium sp. Y11 TaxID=2045016 RepID=UPI00351197F3